eukprot:g3069.t1
MLKQKAFVDKSLFGLTRSDRLKKSGSRSMGFGNHAGVNDTSVMFLRRSEYQRIKRSAVLKTPAQLRREAQEMKRQREEDMKVAYDRKMTMIRAEEERKKRLPPSKFDLEQIAKDEVILKKAQKKLDEQEDDVKLMNQMMQYARTVAVRNSQVEENKRLKAKRALEEKRVDMMMELDRIRRTKMYIDRERKRKEHEKHDKDHILIQIEANKKKREREREMKRQEQIRIKERAKFLEDEEREIQEIKRKEAKNLLDEVLETNRQAIEIAKQRKLAELEEERKIQLYLEKKAAREQALEEKKARVAAQKELECARMRARQKKVADNRAALDALRAKRAAEAMERKARERELREAAERKRRQEELMSFNRLQHLGKKYAMSQAESLDREEFKRNNDHMKKELSRFNAEKQRRHEARVQNARDVRQQIKEREALRRKQQKDFIESGKYAVKDNAQHMAKLNRIKAEKIAELKKMGVPDRYCSELAHHDPERAILNDYKRGGKW